MSDTLAPAPTPVRRDTTLRDPDTGEPYVSARGRNWGAIDLVDGDMRAHIRAAYDSAGGPEYLRALAVSDTPSDRTAFTGLVSKLVPTEIAGKLTGNITVEMVNYAVQQQEQQQQIIEMVDILNSPLLE